MKKGEKTELERQLESFTLRLIPSENITVDPDGQRDVDSRAAQFKKILTEFDWRLVQPPTVAFIDGKYFCIDGQMTIKTLIAKNGRHLNIPCRVLYGLTRAEAATLFLQQRGTTASLKTYEKFDVEVNFGANLSGKFSEKGEKAQRIKALCESNGMKIVGYNTGDVPYSIKALNALEKAYDTFNDESLFESLIRILRDAWGGDPKGTQGKIVSGLTIFMNTYKDEYEEKKLIDRLSRKSPNQIIAEGNLLTLSGAKRYAYVIWSEYNKRTTETHKLPLNF